MHQLPSQSRRLIPATLAAAFLAHGAYASDAVLTTADAILTLSSTSVGVNEDVTVTFSTTAVHGKLSPCGYRMIVLGLEGQGQPWSASSFPAALNTDPPRIFHFKLSKPGKYRVFAEPPSGTPTCGGMNSSNTGINFQVVAPLQVPVVTCPPGFEKDMTVSPEEVKKGALRCARPNVVCPTGWTGSMNPANGVLECVMASVPRCPPGWQGGMVQGKLACEPSMQPPISCPTATPDWKWGTTYYKENWKFLGCSPNPKPAF